MNNDRLQNAVTFLSGIASDSIVNSINALDKIVVDFEVDYVHFLGSQCGSTLLELRIGFLCKKLGDASLSKMLVNQSSGREFGDSVTRLCVCTEEIRHMMMLPSCWSDLLTENLSSNPL